MANLPLLLSLVDDLNRLSFRSSPYYESPISFVRHPTLLALANAAEPTQQLLNRDNHIDSTVSTVGKDGFQVCMDVQQFKPSELNVKVVDNSVVVEGKHEEREDNHGFISRHFVRRYALPKGYDPNNVVSTLSSDGVLTISVPKPQIEDKSNERHIHIQQVGPAHLNVKKNQNTDENSQESSESEKAKL